MSSSSDPLLAAADAAAVTWLSGVRDEMAGLHARVGDDAGRVEALRALEELKSAAAAAQARLTAAFAASQRAEQAAAGVPAARRGRGSPPRSGSPAGSRRTAPRSTSAWPGSWWARCRTRWPG